MGFFSGLWDSIKDAGRKFAGIVGEGLGNAASKVGTWVDTAAKTVSSIPVVGDIAKYAVDRSGIGGLYNDAMQAAGGTAEALKDISRGGSVKDAWSKAMGASSGFRTAIETGADRARKYFQRTPENTR